MKKLIHISLFVLLLFLTAMETHSQVIDWTARFNGSADTIDVANDITVDGSGNSYVTGRSIGLLGLLTGAVTISYDPDGNQRWQAQYDALLSDEGIAIVLDNSQQYVYIAGFTNGLLNLTGADYLIIKYRASDGQQMWIRTYNYGLLGEDRVTGLAVDGLNNVVVTGYSQGLLLLAPFDYVTIKYDQNGNQLWLNRYNGTGNRNDKASAVAIDNAGNVFVTGASERGSLLNYDEDYATIKYNSAGVQQWVSRYNFNNNQDGATAIAIDNSGNVVVTGMSSNGNNEDYATVKYNTSGVQQWFIRYNGPGNNQDRAYAIVVDNTDNVIVTGGSRSGSTSSSEDYATVKYNSAGTQQWVSRYNGPGNSEDRAYAIVVDNTDNVYVTGSSRSTGSAGSEDYASLRYNSTGSQQWEARYDGSGNNEDRAYAIVVDNTDNIYVTGTSRNGAILGSEDYLSIKYSAGKLVSIPHNDGEVPSEFFISKNYPNPFNPSTNFRVDVSKYSHVKLVIYDILGNEKETLINENMTPGSYEVTWTASDLTSGIYFYRISMGDFTSTGKMMLIK